MRLPWHLPNSVYSIAVKSLVVMDCSEKKYWGMEAVRFLTVKSGCPTFEDWHYLGIPPPAMIDIIWVPFSLTYNVLIIILSMFYGLIWAISGFLIISIWQNLGAPSEDWKNLAPPSDKWRNLGTPSKVSTPLPGMFYELSLIKAWHWRMPGT